jgi:peptide/nickel transport system permease protein
MARDETPVRRVLGDFLASPGALVGVALLGIILVVAIATPFVAPQDAYDLTQLDVRDSRLPPGSAAQGGATFWLGTDAQGRDLLSAILYGLRTSLTVGILSTLIALVLGLTMGLCAAYFGGRTAAVITRVAEVQLAFPAFLIALLVLVVLGPGLGRVIAALALAQWAYYARALRGAAQVEQRKPYIEAARCLALAPARILYDHLLPNCLPALWALVAAQVATAIALEATLSFLGIGLPRTEPSLGLLIADGYANLLSGNYWISFFPGVALLLTLLSVHLVADPLREVLNRRLPR